MAKQVKKRLLEKIKLFEETKVKTDNLMSEFCKHQEYAEAAMCKATSNTLKQVIQELKYLFD